VNAPDFNGGGSNIVANLSTATIGDTIKVTLDLANTGLVPAEGMILKLPLDPGLSLQSFTMDGQLGDINGKSVDAAALAAGVDAGVIDAGKARHVEVDVDVAAAPTKALFFFEATWDYAFHVCVGGATLSESYTQVIGVQYDAPTTTASTGASSATASGSGGASTSSSTGGSISIGNGGSNSGGNGDAGGSGGSGDGSIGADGGCSCRVPGSSDAGSRAALGLLAMAALAAARRRRR
jgi:uncharacterized repeat protein (TIGR01451 family)/MYXO-CTERM domain-containing protein